MLSDRDKVFIHDLVQELADRYLKSGKITIYIITSTVRSYSSGQGTGTMIIQRKNDTEQYVLPRDEDKIRREWREEIDSCIEDHHYPIQAYGDPRKDFDALEGLFEFMPDFMDAEILYFTDSTEVVHFSLTEHGALEFIERNKDKLDNPKIEEVPCNDVSLELHEFLDCLVKSHVKH